MDSVEVGGNIYHASEHDIDLEARPFNVYLDIGADEWYPDTEVEKTFASKTQYFTNFPNPFTASTTIAFEVLQHGNVNINIHDMNGREIATITKGSFERGMHQVQFDALALKSGIYFCTLKTESGISNQKIIKLD